VFKQEI